MGKSLTPRHVIWTARKAEKLPEFHALRQKYFLETKHPTEPYFKAGLELGLIEHIPGTDPPTYRRTRRKYTKPGVQHDVYAVKAAQEMGLIERQRALWWVFEALDNQTLKPEDAPSGGFWALLMRLRRDDHLCAKFIEIMLERMQQTKAQMESEAKRGDDGRRTVDLLNALLARNAQPVVSDSTERPNGELEIPPALPATG